MNVCTAQKPALMSLRLQPDKPQSSPWRSHSVRRRSSPWLHADISSDASCLCQTLAGSVSFLRSVPRHSPADGTVAQTLTPQHPRTSSRRAFQSHCPGSWRPGWCESSFGEALVFLQESCRPSSHQRSRRFLAQLPRNALLRRRCELGPSSTAQLQGTGVGLLRGRCYGASL